MVFDFGSKHWYLCLSIITINRNGNRVWSRRISWRNMEIVTSRWPANSFPVSLWGERSRHNRSQMVTSRSRKSTVTVILPFLTINSKGIHTSKGQPLPLYSIQSWIFDVFPKTTIRRTALLPALQKLHKRNFPHDCYSGNNIDQYQFSVFVFSAFLPVQCKYGMKNKSVKINRRLDF